jgi:tetratricopeptide (TPR) repeat protein
LLASNYSESPADKVEKLRQAEANARRAMTIAPKLGTAHSALGFVESSRLNYKSSFRYQQQALALSPNDASVIGDAAAAMADYAQGQASLRLVNRLVELDPLHPRGYLIRAVALWSLRQFTQAIDAAHKALEVDPESSHVHVIVANCLTMMNEFVEAKAEYEKLPAEEPIRMFLAGVGAARSGDIAGAKKTIAHMRRLYGDSWSYQYADIYAQVGEKERAFAELEKAVEAKDPGLGEMKADPYLDPIRQDARYAALVRKLNFP